MSIIERLGKYFGVWTVVRYTAMVGIIFALCSISLSYLYLNGKSLEKISVGLANIWLCGSFSFSLIVTGGCFTSILRDLSSEAYRSSTLELSEAQRVQFTEKYKFGARYALAGLLLLTAICAIYVYHIWYGGNLEDQLTFNMAEFFSIGIALMVFVIDWKLPGLRRLSLEFDLPILISIILTVTYTHMIHCNNARLVANLFSAGAVSIQIIVANMSFKLDTYDIENMAKQFK